MRRIMTLAIGPGPNPIDVWANTGEGGGGWSHGRNYWSLREYLDRNTARDYPIIDLFTEEPNR